MKLVVHLLESKLFGLDVVKYLECYSSLSKMLKTLGTGMREDRARSESLTKI